MKNTFPNIKLDSNQLRIEISVQGDTILKDTIGPYYQKLSDSLNAITNDLLNDFKNIKGTKVKINSKSIIWHSKINLPGLEPAMIYSQPEDGQEIWVWKARLIRTDDKKVGFKSYKDFLKKLRFTKLDCCVTELKENVDYMGDYLATWHTILVVPGKDSKFKTLIITLRYHENIGDNAAEVFLYIQGSPSDNGFR
jgi:hypothetical protein